MKTIQEYNKIKHTLNNILSYKNPRLLIILMFVVIGIVSLISTRAASPTTSIEAEIGDKTGCAKSISNDTASSKSAVKFCSSDTSTAGAKLPITYTINDLPGAKRFVAASNGSDATGDGSIDKPYATLAKAYSASTSGDNIIVRKGVYRDGNLVTTSKSIRIIAYPEEVPEFNGAQVYDGNWTAEGTLRYRSYIPRPVTVGSGINFETCGNNSSEQVKREPGSLFSENRCVGKYADQAWVGDTQLKQVLDKSAVTDSTFWVDRVSKRIYLSETNVNKGGVEVTQRNQFIQIKAANVTLEGFRIKRYSPNGGDYGTIRHEETASNSTIKNIEISDTSYIVIMYPNTKNSRLENVTIENSKWMGVSAFYTDDLTLKRVKIRNMNQFNEFNKSPQSGALKAGRTHRTKVLDSYIADNLSHAVWLDQSNYDTVIANNTIVDNTGTGVFFEISDNLLLINNYIKATTGQPAKLAGSSGLKLVNNTIVGGYDPIGVYTDSRSEAGCSVPRPTPCIGGLTSDWDTQRTNLPVTMDWMPRIDMMINNVVGYPTTASGSLCGAAIPFCITTSHSSNKNALAPLETIIHKANSPYAGMPQTLIDGNVYANGTSNIIRAGNFSYSTVSAFTTAMAPPSPVSIAGIDANSRYGNSWFTSDGTPTPALSTVHNQAFPIPSDAAINLYLPANTRHYGVTNK